MGPSTQVRKWIAVHTFHRLGTSLCSFSTRRGEIRTCVRMLSTGRGRSEAAKQDLSAREGAVSTARGTGRGQRRNPRKFRKLRYAARRLVRTRLLGHSGAEPSTLRQGGTRMSETRSEQERSDTPGGHESLVLGFVILGAIFYFAVVFWQLPDDDQWWTGSRVASRWAILALGGLLHGAHVRGPCSSFGLRGVRLRSSSCSSLSWSSIVPITLDRPERIVLLKAAAIVYFSLLPALLYLQFTLPARPRRLERLRREPLLDAEAPGTCRAPRRLAVLRAWTAARDRAWGKGWVHKQRGRDEAQAGGRAPRPGESSTSIKFRELFGACAGLRRGQKGERVPRSGPLTSSRS